MPAISTVNLGLAKDVFGLATGILAFATALIVYRSKNRETKDAAAKPAKPQTPHPAIAIGPPPPREPRPRLIVRTSSWVNGWRWPENR